MCLLRKFFNEVFGKSPDATPSSKDSTTVDAGQVPSSGGLINPFADDETSEEPDGGKTPAPGGLIDPFADDGPAAPEAPDTAPSAKELFGEAEALYKKHRYAKAAEQYRAAYDVADADQRGPVAFNIAQSFRLAKNFPSAVVWYQKALDLGGPTVNQYREEIDQHITHMQGDMKKHPKRGPGGENLSEAQMLFDEADMAYGERAYAKAQPLYKEAYERSNIPAIAFNIAQACRLGGKYGDAKYWYREYLQKVPDSPYKAEIEGRIEELKQKVPDPPDLTSTDDAKDNFEQADRLYKIGMYNQAADLYADVFYDPAVASARGSVAFNMGQCMRLTGNSSSAVEWYKKALQFLPGDSPYREEIAGRITELSGTEVALP